VRVQSYRELIVWQKAMDLVEAVYNATHDWPRDEAYGLTNQVRRAVVSIPSNIAEGQGRNNPREFVRLLAIANGSLLEVETQLQIANRLTYLIDPKLDALLQQTAETGRLLNGLMRSFRPSLTTDN
jgi:four helix bundle protein